VEDLPKFTDGLQRVRYSAVNAVQEETVDLAAAAQRIAPSKDGASDAETEGGAAVPLAAASA
jgi:hypothetical protein